LTNTLSLEYIRLLLLKLLKLFISDKPKLPWDSNFNTKDYFDYKLKIGVIVRLYRDSILCRYIYDGYEIDEQLFIAKILRKGDYMVDIGANIGLYSLIAAKLVGRKGRVISFEPTPKIYNRFAKNIEINSFKNIDLRNIALSNIQGDFPFYISENGYDAWNSFAKTDNEKFQNKVEVPTALLDNELSISEKPKIKFIKIDVEGWEKFIIEGGRNYFMEYSPIVMVEFTESNTLAAGYFVQEIYDLMNELGYKWYRFENGQLQIETKKDKYPYSNLIAFKTCQSEINKLIK
jgi:FkbM family methyltransferase